MGRTNVHAGDLFDQALQQHRLGNIEAARHTCLAALALQPLHAPAHFVLGVIDLQQGRLQSGVASLTHALRIDPNQPQAHANLGAAFNQLGQPAQALECCDRALRLEPRLALAGLHRGIALRALGRQSEAIASLHQALRAAPHDTAVLDHLGRTLNDDGRPEEARQAFERALTLRPTDDIVRINLGIAHLNLGRPDMALAAFEQALCTLPRNVAAHYNRGVALLSLNRTPEALSAFDAALSVDANCSDAYNGRAIALGTLERWTEAIRDLRVAANGNPDRGDVAINLARACLALSGTRSAREALAIVEQALNGGATLTAGTGILLRATPALGGAADLKRIAPSSAEQAGAVRAELRFLRGFALQQLEFTDAAIDSYRAALQLLPDLPHALNNLGGLLIARGDFAGALEAFENLRRADPEHPYVDGHVRAAASGVCEWSEHDVSTARLEDAVMAGRPACLPLWFLSVSDRPTAQLACARRYLQDTCPQARSRLSSTARYRHSRIRLGYFSGDLREHAVAYLMCGVLEHHDPARFEAIALSLQPYQEGHYGRRIRAAVAQWVDLASLNDEQAAERIRELEIDVLIDLTGHTRGARPYILAARPAPLQVSYLGYPATQGAHYIDYLIGDEFIIPPASRPFYSEHIAFLPDCFQANDAGRIRNGGTPTRAAAGLPASGAVLCCFNNVYKLNPGMFDVWMRLLHALPDSVLWLLAASDPARANLRRAARLRGIDAERLVFAPKLPYPEHLARLPLGDLFLDTLPFNGGTTVSDALWAGLPVLTCTGESMAGRMAGSLLHCLGVPELITTTLVEYEQRALALLRDPAALAAVRSRIETGRTLSPLFDTARFTRHFEAALAHMQSLHDDGLPPQDFHAPPLA